MIDFEKCKITEKPKNVTQLIEFVCRLRNELEKKGIKVDSSYLRTISKEYKISLNKNLIEKAINSLCG